MNAEEPPYSGWVFLEHTKRVILKKRTILLYLNSKCLRKNGMKTLSPVGIISLVLLIMLAITGCQPAYYYHFPKEEELKGIKSDSLKWRYSANTVMQVPVADNEGKLYWLDVTDNTKIDVTTTMGESYRFYLRSIEVSDQGDGIFGSSALWTGFDVRQHAKRTIQAKEISKLIIIAEEPAKTLIKRP